MNILKQFDRVSKRASKHYSKEILLSLVSKWYDEQFNEIKTPKVRFSRYIQHHESLVFELDEPEPVEYYDEVISADHYPPFESFDFNPDSDEEDEEEDEIVIPIVPEEMNKTIEKPPAKASIIEIPGKNEEDDDESETGYIFNFDSSDDEDSESENEPAVIEKDDNIEDSESEIDHFFFNFDSDDE